MNPKQLLQLAAIFLSTVALPATTHAQFAGLDIFSSMTKNTNKWGADIINGVAALIQTNGQIHLIAPGTPETDNMMAWVWATNAPLASSWSVQLDMSVPFITLPSPNTAVGIGIAVLNGEDDSDVLAMNLEQVRFGGPQMQNFFSSLDVDGNGTETAAAASNSSGAVRISWDAASHLLRAWHDGDGASNGYTWTLLRTFDPTASTNWNMNLTNSCVVAVHGYTESIPVTTENNITLDNFFFQDDTRPTIQIESIHPNLVVSWPGQMIDYFLETSGSPSGGWTNSPDSGMLVNDRRQVTFSATTNRFFRLRRNG